MCYLYSSHFSVCSVINKKNNPMANYNDYLQPGKWRSEGQCTCGGTLTLKYEYISDRSIKLRIKPNKNRFNLYSLQWNEWDKPLSDLGTTLSTHGLL